MTHIIQNKIWIQNTSNDHIKYIQTNENILQKFRNNSLKTMYSDLISECHLIWLNTFALNTFWGISIKLNIRYIIDTKTTIYQYWGENSNISIEKI